ncbi:hypothetical protein SAMN04244581_03259 [Paracoccus denitrificans]|jgi:hypothetical protein|nr:hypothetical protein PDE01_27810 [Paracoccus denitrificans]SDJ13746.1 hypothetical protein SAMN04244581_03259 [Paracoccus denitrificans]SFR14273.1 hypothetical protein SAMN04244569_03263 [Paracoccus denitrificans]
MFEAVTAAIIMSGVSALLSGTGWRGFLFGMAILSATAVLLMAIFWLIGALP